MSLWESVIGAAQASEVSDDFESEREGLLRYWAKDPWNWISGTDPTTTDGPDGSHWPKGRPLLWTTDELDETQDAKPFPTKLPYLRAYIEEIHGNRFTFVDKPRQMMITIATCLYIDWHCAFRDSRLWLISKSKEGAASKIINDKIRKTFKRLPKWLRVVRPLTMKPYNLIRYTHSGSEIMAVAQNAAVGDNRGNTASGIFVDEAAFQEQFQEIWSSSAPMAGKFIAVTTAFRGPGGIAFKKVLDDGHA